MTRGEILLCAGFCLVSGVVAALTVVLLDLRGDAAVAVGAFAVALGSLLASQMSIRADRRKEDRVH